MAVIVNPNDPNQQQNAPQGTPDGQPLQTIGTATPSGQAPTGSPRATTQANNLAQRQGSGRFTNLSKYLEANKGAGERIAGQIGQKVGSQLEKEQEKAKQYYGKLGETIGQSKLVADQGVGFQKTLGQLGQQVGQQQIGGQDSDSYKNWLKSSQNIDGFLENGQPNYIYKQITPTQPTTMQDRSGNIVPINTTPVDPFHNINRQVTTPKTKEELYQQYQNEMLAARPQQDLSAITAFTQSPDFKNFQNIQAGRGIDENLLALQQQRAYQQALDTQDQAQQAQQQLGSEAGRFELLRKQFGGSGYTTGQQRLDQALLGGGLSGLRQDVQSRVKTAQEQARLAGGQAQEVGRLTAQEQDLISGINKQAQTNEQAYLDMLTSYADPLQRQRQAEFEGLGAATATYVPTIDPVTGKVTQQAYQPGYNAEQMARLGLTDQNQGVYNVFKDEAFTQAMKNQDAASRNQALANVIASKGMEARTAQDVANQEDLARYKALQSIIGKDAADRLTSGTGKVGEEVIGKSYEAKTDDASLKTRLDKAQELYNQAAKKTIQQRQSTGSIYGAYATPEELMSKRSDALRLLQTYPWTIENTNYLNNQFSGGQGIIDNTYSGIKDKFRQFLAEQNYNRTLGGQRQTFLDTETAQNLQNQGIAAPLKGAPITGTDPSLAYLNDIVGKLPIKGS